MYADGDIPWLPYKGSSINSSVSLALGLVSTVSTLGNALASVAMMSETEISNRRRAIRHARDSHFSNHGLMHQIKQFIHHPLKSDLTCSEPPESFPSKPLRENVGDNSRISTNLSLVYREIRVDDFVLTFTCAPEDGFRSRAAAFLAANTSLALALCTDSTMAAVVNVSALHDDLHSKSTLPSSALCALTFLEKIVSSECAKWPVVDADTCGTMAECGQIFRAEANAVIDASDDILNDSSIEQQWVHEHNHARGVEDKADGRLKQQDTEGHCVPRQNVVSHGWNAFVDSHPSVGYTSSVVDASSDNFFSLDVKYYCLLRNRCRIVQFFTSGLCEQWRNFLVSARETGVEDLLIVFALDYETVECVRKEQRLRTVHDVGGVGGFGADWPGNADRMVPALDLSLLRSDLQSSVFGTDGFRRITELKFKAISLVLQLKLLVLYLDTDVILFADPFSDLIDGDMRNSTAPASFLPRDLWVSCLLKTPLVVLYLFQTFLLLIHPLQIQSDRPDFKSGIYADEDNEFTGKVSFDSDDEMLLLGYSSGRNVCSGVMLWTPTCASLELISELQEAKIVSNLPQSSDQGLLNESLTSFESSLENAPLWFDILGPAHYPNGPRFFSSNLVQTPVLLHYNWIATSDLKKTLLVANGLWRLPLAPGEYAERQKAYEGIRQEEYGPMETNEI